MMFFLCLASVLALIGLAVAFVARLAIRLFSKRRPRLVTLRMVVVAVVAVGIIIFGSIGNEINRRHYTDMIEAMGELQGATMDEVATRLGPPDSCVPVELDFCPDSTVPRLNASPSTSASPAFVCTYRSGVWYSAWYPPSCIHVFFDTAGRCSTWQLDDSSVP